MAETNETRKQTLGEYRVGIGFNPGGHARVNEAKRMAADLITKAKQDQTDYVEGLNADQRPDGEVLRLYDLAQTAYEEAAMWHVKAITKDPQHS